MICECKDFYVGKTIRELHKHIGDHLYCSTNGKLTIISRHIELCHRFDPQVVTFFVLDVIPQDPGGVTGTRLFCNVRPCGLRGLVPPLHQASMKYYRISPFCKCDHNVHSLDVFNLCMNMTLS